MCDQQSLRSACEYAGIRAFACHLSMVNVLKLRTLKNNYFSAVRNFRNYACEKMLVFEILECGLYHEKKRHICMSKCGRKVLKTRGYDSVLSLFFFSLILLKRLLNSCGLSL